MNDSKAPDPSFVRDTYNALLKKLPGSYTAYRWGETPVSRFHFRQSRRALLRALRFVPKWMERILEIGGGDGAWTPFFASRAQRLDFLDISKEMLAGAREALTRFRNIQFIEADFLSWTPQPDAYNMVVSLRNLEYMKDKKAAVLRMASALRSGGYLILSTKNPQYDWNSYFEGKELHGGQIPLSDLESLLQRSGFSILRVYPAIIGKKTKYGPVRILWDVLQILFVCAPAFFVPWWLMRYLSESFLVVARRI